MGEALGKAAEKLAGLPATLFSPAKMVYIAYVLIALVTKDAKLTSLGVFNGVSLFFVLAEVLHNDWLRILLNYSAEKSKPEWDKPEWFVQRQKQKDAART